MSSLTVCVGIPASGKTTYALQWVREKAGRVRVNRDDLRFMMYGTYHGGHVDEREVTVAQDSIILNSLSVGLDVIVDNTNLSTRVIQDFETTAHCMSAEFNVKRFDISLNEALDRNNCRSGWVPQDVIRNMYDRYKELVESNVI